MSKPLVLLALLACGLTSAQAYSSSPHSLAGDWDVYIALSARPKFGFEGWRRMGFAHFAGDDSSSVGFLKRRTGEPMLVVNHVATNGDSVILTQDARVVMRGAWRGDTLAAVQYVDGQVLDRRFRGHRRQNPATRLALPGLCQRR